MKALMKMKPGVGHISLQEIKEPSCAPNEMKVEIRAAGICGTDLRVYDDTFKNYPPVILGHELAGVIVEVGGEIKSFQPGDRVALLGSNKIVCGQCEFCKTGYYMFCRTRRGMGHGTNGGFTKYVCVREDMAFLIPDGYSMEEAAILEAFASSVQAVEEVAALNGSSTVLISGPGPIGLMCLLLTAKKRIKTFVSGLGEDAGRLEIAKELGGIPIDISKENLKENIMHETDGRGVDVCIECSGASGAIITGLELLRPMGTFIQMGHGATAICLNLDHVVHRGLAIKGSVGHSMHTWELMMRMLKNTHFDLSKVITHRFPLSKWEEAFALMRNKESLKIVLYYDFDEGGAYYET